MMFVADRERYFKKDPRWMRFPTHMIPYKDMNFHQWVYKIDNVEYPFCTPEFKEAYKNNLLWERLQQ